MSNTIDLCSMTREELAALLAELSQPAFRAGQLFSWLQQKRAASYDEMLNLPKALRETLKETAPVNRPEVVRRLDSADGVTHKYLMRLYDGEMIESVHMHHPHGEAVCISSQVGCRMGCRFCASTLDGLVRDLTAGEMLGQIMAIEADAGVRISHVDVMGSGEPLENYENLVRFIRLVSHPDGMCVSQRNLTVSTCGIVPAIDQLAKEQFQLTLVISLHASNDERRRALMPIANRYSIEEVLAACRRYFKQTGRRISFAYSLIAGENDSDKEATELALLLAGMNCHVNLIPVNPIRERSYARSGLKAVLAFQKKLEKCGINVTIRKEMGADIEGACGQLRRRYLSDPNDTSGRSTE